MFTIDENWVSDGEGELIPGLFCGEEVSDGFLADEARVAQPRKG